MKGIVFNEFVSLVEAKFGDMVLDQVITEGAPESGGAFTTAGYYDHAELVAMVVALSKVTGVAAGDLVRAFGQHLFGKLIRIPSMQHAEFASAYDFLARVDDVIHVEVVRLYPDAELPKLETRKTEDGGFELIYRSRRRLADLAHGMVEGCLAHYQSPAKIVRTELPDEGSYQVVRFNIS